MPRWDTPWLVSENQEERNQEEPHYCPHLAVCRLVRKEKSKKCHQEDFQKEEKMRRGKYD